MEKEQHMPMMIIGAITIVALVGVIMLSNNAASGQAIRGQTYELPTDGVKNSGFVNAHSCTADDACEVNSLQINNAGQGTVDGWTKYLCVNPDGTVFASLAGCEGYNLYLSVRGYVELEGSDHYTFDINGTEYQIKFVGGSIQTESIILRLISQGQTETRSIHKDSTIYWLGLEIYFKELYITNIGDERKINPWINVYPVIAPTVTTLHAEAGPSVATAWGYLDTGSYEGLVEGYIHFEGYNGSFYSPRVYMTEPSEFSGRVYNLEPCTTYNYRAVAVWDGGNHRGRYKNITTTGCR